MLVINPLSIFCSDSDYYMRFFPMAGSWECAWLQQRQLTGPLIHWLYGFRL